MGICQFEEGVHSVAIKHYEKALRVRRGCLRKDHPAISDTLNRLLPIKVEAGKQRGGRALLEEALEIRLAACGDGHETVALARVNLAKFDSLK